MTIRLLCTVLAILLMAAGSASAQVPGDLYSKAPLVFEVNRGQADPSVQFLSRGNGYGLYLTRSEAVLSLAGTSPVAIRMKLPGRGPELEGEPLEPQPGVSNYFVGANRESWQSGIPRFAKVRYPGVYQGIDLVYYGNQRQLEYDFIVAPFADPSPIRLDFSGIDRLSLNTEGDLVLHTPAGNIRHQRPVAFQETETGRRPVAAEFVLYAGGTRAGFKLGAYDHALPLTIDPTMIFSSYFGGSNDDAGMDVAVDSLGSIYLTGYTASSDFNLINEVQGGNAGNLDAFITKISAGGTILYSTYIGGSGEDEGHSIAVDANGNAYITGFTTSSDFPVVNGLQPAPGGLQDAYALKLNASGSAIDYSTFLGGARADRGLGIDVDSTGTAVIAGTTSSVNFPLLNALRSTYAGGLGDAFVTRISSSGALVYSSFMGGLGNDQAYDVAFDSENNVILTGFTSSTNFPTANALYSQYRGGADDVFITKLNPSGSALVFSTYLGGSQSDNGVGLAIDAEDHIYVTGYTASIDFPLKRPAQIFHGGGFDAFLIRLQPDGRDASFSTFIGSEDTESGVSVAIANDGSIYLAGFTNSLGFYAVNAIGGFLRGARDGFLMRFSPDASDLIFSTYLGGFGADGATAVAVDYAGNALVTGFTLSGDFPVETGFMNGPQGGQDGFIAKINSDEVTSISTYYLGERGVVSFATAGRTSNPVFGYGTADIGPGMTMSAMAILDLRSAGVLVNEVSLPVTPPTNTGRFFAITTVSDTTALTLVNPSFEDSQVDFYFTSQEGETRDFRSFILPAGAHVSALLTDPPFSLPFDQIGAATFTSVEALSATALRVTTNGPNPVNSYTPITDPYAANGRRVTVPQWADGGGWFTQFQLVNTTEFQMTGELRLVKAREPGGPGIPAELATDHGVTSVFTYDIAPRTAQTFATLNEGAEMTAGHADVVPDPGTSTPATSALLTLNENNGVMQMAVEAVEPGSNFKMYVESSGVEGEALAATPSVAIANSSDHPATVQLELFDENGVPSGLSASVALQPHGHVSEFLNKIPGFETLPSPFTGVLRFTTADAAVTVAGFRNRTNEREQRLALATGPMKDVGGASLLVVPHVVDGGGYATQFVFINEQPGGEGTGIIRYWGQAGQAINISILD